VKKKHADPVVAPAPAPDAPAADPRDAEIERLRAREDELLRAIAEFQNINRRRRLDADKAQRYAAEPLLRELLPVLDDLERALQAFSDPEDPHRTGVALVQDRLHKLLEREGLEAIRPLDAPFDPELHDAIAHLPFAGVPPGTVVEVAAAGYRYRDRVLRHAKVVVAADPAEPTVPATPAEPADGTGSAGQAPAVGAPDNGGDR
jgi:molecular chaperone GrpE